MAKESSEGEFLKKKYDDHNRKRIENLSKANAVKEKVIHSVQFEFLLSWFNWWVSFAPEFLCCYFCES